MQKTHGCRNHGIFHECLRDIPYFRHDLPLQKKVLKSYCKFCTNRFYPLGSGVNKILTEICCALYTVQTSVLHILCNQNEIWCSIFANAKCSSLPPSSTHVCCTCVYLWGSLLMLLATFVFPASQC